MRRFLARSCLFAVLTVPLLCQAEAAEDLARSLAELADRGVIENCDPGDGGPAFDSLRAERSPGLDLDGSPSRALHGFTTLVLSPHSTGPAPARSPAPVSGSRPPNSTLTRRALLGSFLF